MLSLILKRLVEVVGLLLGLKSGQAEIRRLVSLIDAKVDANHQVVLANNQEVLRSLESIVSLLRSVSPGPANPIVAWRLLSERKDIDMWLLKYEADLPAIPDVPENVDVVGQRVSVEVDGIAIGPAQDIPKDVKTVMFEVFKGAKARLSSKLYDDDGIESETPALSEEFEAKDTIPPSAPGAFGEIRLLGEREVPDEPVPGEPTV